MSNAFGNTTKTPCCGADPHAVMHDIWQVSFFDLHCQQLRSYKCMKAKATRHLQLVWQKASSSTSIPTHADSYFPQGVVGMTILMTINNDQRYYGCLTHVGVAQIDTELTRSEAAALCTFHPVPLCVAGTSIRH